MEINTAGYNEFLTAIKTMVLGDPTSIEVFADGIGISTSHLYQKLDPNYPEAKLTAREAFILMMNCQGLQPVIFLCAKRNLRADSLDCITSDKPTLAEELLDNASAYARYQEVMANSNASEEDATLARMELNRELDEDHVAFCMARVKGHVYEGGKARLTHVSTGSGKGSRRQ